MHFSDFDSLIEFASKVFEVLEAPPQLLGLKTLGFKTQNSC
jgi:hypothetical protein